MKYDQPSEYAMMVAARATEPGGWNPQNRTEPEPVKRLLTGRRILVVGLLVALIGFTMLVFWADTQRQIDVTMVFMLAGFSLASWPNQISNLVSRIIDVLADADGE